MKIINLINKCVDYDVDNNSYLGMVFCVGLVILFGTVLLFVLTFAPWLLLIAVGWFLRDLVKFFNSKKIQNFLKYLVDKNQV